MWTYRDNCSGCIRSQGRDSPGPPGGIIRLSGNWILNQYEGSEGFLGWLALQPRFHRDRLVELTPDEVAHFGAHIRAVDAALTQFWKFKFPEDAVERVYVTYFNESPFDIPPPSPQYHLHWHLIPRTEKLGTLLRENSSETQIINAWKIWTLKENVPVAYRRHDGPWPVAEELVVYLRHELERLP